MKAKWVKRTRSMWEALIRSLRKNSTLTKLDVVMFESIELPSFKASNSYLAWHSTR